MAIRTGSLPAVVGGLVVIDIDPGHGGDDSLEELLDGHQRLPSTAVVSTGSGGRHLYFAHPGRPVRNSAGTRLGPGLDVRGDGGYVVAPPSVHASGSSYRWALSTSPVAMPSWLVDLIAPERPRIAASPEYHGRSAAASSWAAAAMCGELRRVAEAADGGRNHALNRSAFVLGQLVGGGHLDHEEVAEALRRAGLAIGLGTREVRATISSGLVAGETVPRHPSNGSGRPCVGPDDARTVGPEDSLDLRGCDLPEVGDLSARTRPGCGGVEFRGPE